jgi:CRP-like cAMP-binding protein
MLNRLRRGSRSTDETAVPYDTAGNPELVDPQENRVRAARSLARAGRAAEAAQAYRDAADGFLISSRPVQAIASAIEAAWLDPAAPSPSEEAIRVARRTSVPVQPATGNQLIAHLDPSARAALVARLHPVEFGIDEVIAREGDLAESIWFVVRGRLLVTSRGARGSRLSRGVVGPGEVVGESSVLSGGRRLATLVCEESTALLELRRSDLEALSRAYPEIRQAFLRLGRTNEGAASREPRKSAARI